MKNGFCDVRAADGRRLVASRQPRRKNVEHCLQVKRLSPSAIEFRQSVQNIGHAPLHISALHIFDGVLELERAGWHVAHSEWFKRERCFDGFGFNTGHYYVRAQGLKATVGLSEDWPFPGLFFTHPEYGTVLMAVLSQERFKPCWSLWSSGRRTRVQAIEGFTGVDSVTLAPGDALHGEHWVLLSVAGGVEDALDAYYQLLRQRLDFAGARSILRRAVVWGTWNYNRRKRGFADVNHKMVVDNTRALRKLVSGKPRVVMIDDGYQQSRSEKLTMKGWFCSCLEIFHDDGQPPHDPKLFPKGMQGIAEAIRREGVMPALWATPRLRSDSTLARDRPEWLLQTENPAGFGPRSAYLDYSLPEVREFTRNAWRTIFQVWGFQGLKLDFWSLPFEVPQVRYRNPERTAVELRNLFLEDLRAIVPKDGFLLLCCVTNTGGNPFVGRYADAVRMGRDIGIGKFRNVWECASQLTMSAHFYRHDCLLGDADSIGWCPENPPGQNRLWATMAFLSGGMCEIGGDLTGLSPEARAMLRVISREHGPRLRTRNVIFDPGVGGLPASRIVLESDGAVYVGELNWSLLPREIRLAAPVRDLWSGKWLKDRHRIPPDDAIMYRQ
ncbi:MAG: alpha-galactosidase [Lentisphaerae bacterium]|nr:alpha-galactosidase [Lentisphaerota bacterium]